MLKIRPEQIEAFTPVMDAAFEGRVTKYLRENHTDVVVRLPSGTLTVKQIPDETLHKMVRNGLTRAHRYGLSWQSTLTAFVALMFEIAPNFDKQPVIQEVLKDERVTPNERIDVLTERTSDGDWDEAERSYNSSAWELED